MNKLFASQLINNLKVNVMLDGHKYQTIVHNLATEMFLLL